METRESVVVVTGASSGIGNACATLLAKKGGRVFGTCRDPSSFVRKADEFFEMLAMDLADPASITKAAEKVLATEGHIDALVCCAGGGLLGSVEEVSQEETEGLVNVNFIGTLRTIKAFLPYMREAQNGRIILVGALEGLTAAPFQAIFSACAFALEGLVQSLRMEMSGFGVEIGIVEAGSFRTAFGRRRRTASIPTEGSPYRTAFENVLSVLSRDEARGLDPLIAAKTIYSMLSSRHMPFRKMSGSFRRRLVAHSRRWFSAGIFERIMRFYYGLDK
jgi:short-subunit dehydrogenase